MFIAVTSCEDVRSSGSVERALALVASKLPSSSASLAESGRSCRELGRGSCFALLDDGGADSEPRPLKCPRLRFRVCCCWAFLGWDGAAPCGVPVRAMIIVLQAFCRAEGGCCI
jgi:hypothetical protein